MLLIIIFFSLQAILPDSHEYEYIVCEFETLSDEAFHTVLRLNVESKDDCLTWKSQFEDRSLSTLRVSRTKPNVGVKISYKVGLFK